MTAVVGRHDLLFVIALQMDTGGKYPDVRLVELKDIGSVSRGLGSIPIQSRKGEFLGRSPRFLAVNDVTGDLKTKPCQHPVKLPRETGPSGMCLLDARFLMCDRLDLHASCQVEHTLTPSDEAFQPGFLSRRLDDWRTIAGRTDQGGDEVIIALVGNYKDRWTHRAASTARLRLACPSLRR